jgi:4-alpha-glucanotransferase
MNCTNIANTDLAKLAQRMGISPEFRDARGNVVRTTADTQRRLLEAVGIHAGNDSQVEESNRALDRAAWSRALPPVKVLRKGIEPLVVDIVLPKEVGRMQWQLTLELAPAFIHRSRGDGQSCAFH